MSSVSTDSLILRYQFEYRNWDGLSPAHAPFLLDPLVLSSLDHALIVSVVERLHRQILRARAEVIRRPQTDFLSGIDPWTRALLAREQQEAAASVEIARYDFFKDTAGRWNVSEINNDVPSGFNESSCLRDFVPDRPEWRAPAEDATRLFVDAVLARGVRTLAMVYGTAYSEDLQVCLFLKDRLEARGCEVVLASPTHLRLHRGKAFFWDRRVDAVYRVYPMEWFSSLPNRSVWERLAAAGIPVINPFSGIVSQHKSFFGLLQRGMFSAFEPGEWDALRSYLPSTESFDPARVRNYRDERDAWVLKPVFGRMGYDVTIGRLQTPEKWEKKLAEAVKNAPVYCMQKYFDTAAVQFEAGSYFPCVGVYVIDGKFAGYFTRVSPTPLTTYEAIDVATVVKNS